METMMSLLKDPEILPEDVLSLSLPSQLERLVKTALRSEDMIQSFNRFFTGSQKN